jgi:hypothetical protein
LTEIAVFPTYKVPSTLFGASARAEFKITPALFATMMPHQQTELCLLAHEAGHSVRKLARLCGLLETTVRDVMEKQHSFDVLSLIDRNSDEVVAVETVDVKVKEASDGIGAHALRFICRLPMVGASHFRDMTELECFADLPKGSGGRVVGNLYRRGLIVRAPAKRGYAFSWSLTAHGQSQVERTEAVNTKSGEGA